MNFERSALVYLRELIVLISLSMSRDIPSYLFNTAQLFLVLFTPNLCTSCLRNWSHTLIHLVYPSWTFNTVQLLLVLFLTSYSISLLRTWTHHFSGTEQLNPSGSRFKSEPRAWSLKLNVLFPAAQCFCRTWTPSPPLCISGSCRWHLSIVSFAAN